MILTLLSHFALIRILLIVGIAFIALPIFFCSLNKKNDKLRTVRGWGVFLGILMCLPMAYYFYADIRYGLKDFSENDKLFLAAENKNLGAARKFIEAGADPCGITRYRLSPITRAVELNETDMVKLFLDSGADPNFSASADMTILGKAAANLNVEMVGILLDAGADPDYMPEKFIPALHLAAANDKDYNDSLIALLVSAGADTSSHAMQNGRTMLPFRYYYDAHKADEDYITDAQEARYQHIKDMLYDSYIEWLNDKMTTEIERSKNNETVS